MSTNKYYKIGPNKFLTICGKATIERASRYALSGDMGIVELLGKSLLISIRSSGNSKPASPASVGKSLFQEILFLEFDDISKPIPEMPSLVLISDEEAKKIVEAVKRNASCETIICQCEAGISRSSGVAAAIMKWATGDDTPIMSDHDNYMPNLLVYEKVLNALREIR